MKDLTTAKPVEILLVEDNPGDALLTRQCLDTSKVRNNLYVAENGIEAMAFLHRQGRYRSVPRPDVILLDLNLPGKDGREVLAEVKNDPDLKSIPIIIFTSSDADEDILRSYNAHANCYITKPVDFRQFHKVVVSIEQFWSMIVRLPRRSEKK
jgi:two-component system, chemotaxis family, response regulator Rcp1